MGTQYTEPPVESRRFCLSLYAYFQGFMLALCRAKYKPGTEVPMQEPFSETFRVLERHKIRLTKDVYSRIPFFAKKTPETVKAVAVPGRYGGIQIIFEDASLTN